MRFLNKALVDWRRRTALVAVATVAAGLVTVSQLSTAAADSVLKGNQDPDCVAYEAFKSYSFEVNGKALKRHNNFRDLKNKVDQGDTVTFKFELKKKCKDVYVGLDSYKARSAEFKPDLQDLYQRDDGRFNPGKRHVLEVKVPECYFQVDAYTSGTFTPGDYTGGGGKGFLTGDLGGDDKKCAVPPPTTQPEKHDAAVDVSQVCKEDASGWKIEFRNDGNVEETFTVKSGGKTLDTVKVAAGKTTTKNYSFETAKVAPGKSIKLEVSANGKVISNKTITNDCTRVAAEIDYCVPASNGVPATLDGAVLTFKNTGKLTELFNVTRNGAVVTGSPVSVPAGTTVQRKLPLAEDEKASLVITSERGDLRVAKDVTNDCVAPPTVPPTTAPAQVLGEQVVRPQLAATGSDVSPLLLGGAGLLVLGAGLLGLSRRRAFKRS